MIAEADAAAPAGLVATSLASTRRGSPRAYVPGRDQALRMRLSPVELAAIREAAASAGLTPSGYAAEAALAAARGTDAPSVLPLRAALWS